MPKKKSKSNIFLLSWDQTGLESVIPLSDIEQEIEQANRERVWAILRDDNLEDPGNVGDIKLNRIVNSVLLRARVNSQRHYEVYTVHTSAGITEKDLWEMFNNNPQQSAELIRERGTMLYSDRASTKVLIT